MHALLRPHEAIIDLAVSSKVTFSFRSILFLSSSSSASFVVVILSIYLIVGHRHLRGWLSVKKPKEKVNENIMIIPFLPSSLSKIINCHLWISRSSLINPPFSVPLLATRSPPWQLLQLKGNVVVCDLVVFILMFLVRLSEHYPPHLSKAPHLVNSILCCQPICICMVSQMYFFKNTNFFSHVKMQNICKYVSLYQFVCSS